MQRRAARRWLAVTGIAAALVVSSAVPASADPAPTLGVLVPDTLIAAGSAGTEIRPIILASDHVAVHNLTVKYDVGAISALVEIAFDDFTCDRVADVITCVYEDETIDPWGLSPVGLTIEPKAAATAGDEAQLKATVSGDGFAAVSDTAMVSIGEGVDLAAEVPPALLTKAPGAAYSELLGVQNVGSTVAHGAVLLFFGDYAIEAGDTRYSNCTYDSGQYRACVFTGDLAPDKAYGFTFPFRLRSDTLGGSSQAVEFAWMTPAEWDTFKAALVKQGSADVIGEPGNGPAATLAEKAKGEVQQPENELSGRSAKQVDEDPTNNWALTEIQVTGNLKGDVAAVGARASGAVGETVTVKVGIKNNGPAAIDFSRGGDSVADTVISIPPGATATVVPFECYAFDGAEPDFDHPGKAGAAQYVCFTDPFLPAGGSSLLEFQLRIDTATPDAKGKVLVTNFFEGGPLQPRIDANPKNNVAYIVLNGTTTEEPTEPANPSPSGDDNGGLPVTGTPVAIVGGIGLLLAATGFVLFRMARRRRLTEI